MAFLGVVSAKLTVRVSFKTRKTKYYPESTLATAPLVFYSHYTHLRRLCKLERNWKEKNSTSLYDYVAVAGAWPIVNGQCVGVCFYMSVCR